MYLKISCVILAVLYAVTTGAFAAHRVKRQVIKTSAVGGKKILECDIDYPGGVYIPHVIKWTKEGIETPIYIKFNTYSPHIDEGYKDRIKLVEKASIELSRIKETDEGWYECIVNFLDGTDETTQNGTKIYLSVNAAPEITTASPSLMQQRSGTTITIYCESSGTPNPILTWKKNGKDLVETDRIKVNRNKVTLMDLQIQDGGVYACHFENIIGEATHTIKVIVEGGTYIVDPPKNITAREGQRIKFACKAEAYPSNITYHWYKDNVDIQLLDDLLTRATVYADGGLVISMLSKTDSGWYKCRPSNGMGMAPEAKGYLNVTYVPRVLFMPSSIYLPKGMRGEIKCPVDANPPVSQVGWTKNDHGINRLTNPRIAIDSNWTLIFSAVKSGDAGRYTCTPYSLLGTGNTSPVVQVYVKDPPYFTLRPMEFYQKLPNQSVTFPCAAKGEPQPTITWRRADGKMPPGKRLLKNDTGLTIVGLSKTDHGQYECIAMNKVTSIITTTQLIIESTTPHAPINVTAVMGLFSAKVSWLPAYDGGYPQHYVLWFKVVDENPENWKTMRVLPDRTTTFTLYNLIPDTEYEFSVLSRNQLGDGMFSKVVKSKTKGYAPGLVTALPTYASGSTYFPKLIKKQGPAPGPPRNIKYQWMGKDLEISWLPPKNTTVPVMYYKIENYEKGEWTVFSQEIVNKTVFIIRGFSPSSKHFEFRVISYGVLNRSEPSSVVKLEPRTADQTQSGLIMSQAAIWGIVGGLLFLLVAVILALIAVKCFNQRREKKKKVKYGNVKYFGPKQLDANKHNNSTNNTGNSHTHHNENHDRSTRDRGGHRVKIFAPFRKERVFVLPKSHPDPMRENCLLQDRANIGECDNEAMLRNLPDDDDEAGFKTFAPGKRPQRRPHSGYRIDLERPIGRIERTPDGRFMPAADDSWREYPAVHNVNDIITDPNVNCQRYKTRPCHEYPYHEHPGNRGYDPETTGYGPDPWRRPENTPDSSMQSNMGSSRSSDDYPKDGVIIRPVIQPLDQTFLTSSPDLHDNLPPFYFNNVSSVLPSSQERAMKPYPSRNLPYFPPKRGNTPGDFTPEPFNPHSVNYKNPASPRQHAPHRVPSENLNNRASEPETEPPLPHTASAEIPPEFSHPNLRTRRPDPLDRSQTSHDMSQPSLDRTHPSIDRLRDHFPLPRRSSGRFADSERSYPSFDGSHSHAPSFDRSHDAQLPFDRSRDRSHDNQNSHDRQPSFDRSRDQNLPFDRSRDQNLPLDRSRDQNLPFDRSRDQNMPFDRSRDQNMPIDRLRDQNMPFDRSHDQNLPFDRSRDQNMPFDTSRDEQLPFDRSRERSHDRSRDSQPHRLNSGPPRGRSLDRSLPHSGQLPSPSDDLPRVRSRSCDRSHDEPAHEMFPARDQLAPHDLPDVSSSHPAPHDGYTPSYDTLSDQYTPDEFRGMIPSTDDVFTSDPEPRDVHHTSFLGPSHHQPRSDLNDLPNSAENPKLYYYTDSSENILSDPAKQVAMVHPSPQRGEENESDSSGRPVEYTRDHLHGTIERIRNSQRSRKVRPVSGDSALDSILRAAERSPRPQLGSPERGSMYASNIAPYKTYPRRTSVASASSGLGSAFGSRRTSSGPYPGTDGPDSFSHSSTSGIGSRNTSNSTGSALPSLNHERESYLNPPEEVSDSSSLYSIEPPPLYRDASVDENYEFDTENGLESDILDIIRQYHRPRQLSFDMTRGYPASPLSPEERCDRLKEEFREFRRRQISGELEDESYL